MERFNFRTFFNDLNAMSGQQIFDMMISPIIILVLSFSLGLFINHMIARRLTHHFKGRESSISYIVLRAVRGIPMVWIVSSTVYVLIPTNLIPGPLESFMSYFIQTLILFTLIQALARSVTGILEVYAQRSDNLQQTTLMSNVLTVFIYAIGFLVILDSLGISITPVITAMGVGGMAVALGLQETLSNICAGMYLLISRQLKVGDYIKLNSSEIGQVADITWRFTTINSSAGNAIIVPNKQISSSIITNYCQPEPDMSVGVDCGVAYDSDLDRVEQVCLEVANEVTAQVTKENNKPATVYFHTFNESSIDFTVYLHCRVFTQQKPLKHAFIKAITKRFAQEGIEIPFPIRTVYNYHGTAQNEVWAAHRLSDNASSHIEQTK